MKNRIRNLTVISCFILFPYCCVFPQEQQAAFSVRELAPDGAWTWYNDERTIVDGKTLILGSLDSQGVSRVDLYDMQTGLKTACPLSTWTSFDDHNNPALLKMSNGQILACYAQHNRQKQWNWRIAEYDGLKLKWGSEQTFKVPAGTTYNNLAQLSDENDRIYNFSRNVNFNPNIQYSDDMAKTWRGPFLLLKTGRGGTRPYVKYADNGKDRIDFLYTDGHPRNEPTNNVYHMYYRKGNFFKSDGTLIKTIEQVKKDPMVPTDGTLVYDGRTEGRGWVWDIEYDKDGGPVAAFINSVDYAEGNDLRYRYARWDVDAKKWTPRQIAFAGTHIYVPENHYAGGFSIDPEDSDTVYISADVDPSSGRSNPSGRYQIFQGITPDEGKTWNWKQLTFDTAVDNLRPFVPRGHGRRICVIWFQGQYKTYTDYKAKIVGVIEN